MTKATEKIKNFMGNLKNMRKRNWVIIGVVAVVLILVILVPILRARSQNAAAGQYQTQAIANGDLTATIGATGTVRANQTAILTWQTSGAVSDVLAENGAQVQAGDVLAVLSQTSLSQNIVLAQADLVSAQRNLDSVLNSNTQSAQAQVNLINAQHDRDSAQSSLDLLLSQNRGGTSSDIQDSQSKLTLAQDAWNRARDAYNLVKDNSDSDPIKAQAYINLYNAQTALDNAQENLNFFLIKPSNRNIDQARAKLALAEAKLADAQREYDRLKDGTDPNDVAAAQARVDAAQATINLARLIAPFRGTITEAHPMPGDLVSPGTVGFRLDDLSHKLVDIQVSEVDINTVQVGQPVTLTFDAILNKNYNGKVVEVLQVGDVVQGAVTFTVTVELTDPDALVKPGMTAAVSIIVHQLTDVLLVPNRAVRLVDNQRVVYILQKGKVLEIPITLGASSDTNSEVASGDLKVGDQVILNPPTNFNRPSGGGGMFGGGG